MNSIAIKHLAWKEYRHSRPIVITMGLFFILLLIFNATDVVQWEKNSFVSPNWLWAACSVLCTIFGLILGVTTFSMEKEQGTDAMLSNLPIQASSLALGKLLPGLAVTVLFSSIVLLGLCIFSFDAQTIQAAVPDEGTSFKFIFFASLIVLPAMEMFAWGTLFALLTQRTLLAAVVAAFTASLVIYLTRELFPSYDQLVSYSQVTNPWAFTTRFVLAISVLAIDVFVAQNWSRRLMGTAITFSPFSSGKTIQNNVSNHRSLPLVKLVWQTLRQSIWTLLSAIFVITLLSLSLAFSIDNSPISQHYVLALLVPTLFTFLGICTFWNDQKGSAFLFFQQHAEYGRWVWLARMILWSVAFLVGFVVFTFVAYVASGSFYLSIEYSRQAGFYEDSLLWVQNIVPMFITCLGCFAIGQFCSMYFRSLIIGPLFAGIFSFLFMSWVILVFWLYVGFWWSVLPVVIALIWATWWFAPNWISENRKGMAAFQGAATIGAVFVSTFIGIIFYRAYDVPQLVGPELVATSSDPNILNLEGSFDIERSVRRNHYVVQDQLDQAYAYRETLRQAVKDYRSFQDRFPNVESRSWDFLELAEIPDEVLSKFVAENRDSIDKLLGIENPYGVMPSLPTQGELVLPIREMLLANAEHSLRQNQLKESYESLTQYLALAQTAHYQFSTAYIGSGLRFWERWMEHPEQSVEMLENGIIPLPTYLGPSANLAYFDLIERTNEELARTTGYQPMLGLPAEIKRTRKLNEFRIASQFGFRDGLLTFNTARTAGHLKWFSRNNFLDFDSFGAVPRKWSADIGNPGYPAQSGRFLERILRTKHYLLTVKAETGSFPASESLPGDFTYRPKGMDGDVYVWNGVDLKLIVEKGRPFLATLISNYNGGMYPVSYERWLGIPSPDEEPYYQVELFDGTIIECQNHPQKSTFLKHSVGSRLPTYYLQQRGHISPMEIAIADVKRITPSRELGEGDPTYLIGAQESTIEVVYLDEK